MIYAVFLCDSAWNIQKIQQNYMDSGFREGDSLKAQVKENERLDHLEEEHQTVLLSVTGWERKIPAFIKSFREGYLVVLVEVGSAEEFMEFTGVYDESLEWAKEFFQGLYHNEYYLISQINNQLVDSQRALTLANQKLKVAKETAEKAMEIAEKANESKSRFLANVSHDIRTPMNAIVGIANLMEYELSEPEKMREHIRKLKTSGEHLLGLLNDILDLSKIESDSMELRRDPVNLTEQLEQVLTVIRPQAKEKDQTFLADISVTKERYFLGDGTRLRQILINLLSNAVKYTPAGGTVSLQVQERMKPEREKNRIGYGFVVKDNGIGMSEEFLQHIFEPFSRSNQAVKSAQGTGLGMSITKNIVDAMGGTIQVESRPGEGSRFEVYLTFEQTEPKKEKKEKQAQPVKLEGMHFLCAEDNELNAEILESMLALHGATCTICENGAQLVQTFETVKDGEIQAVLTDIQMPVMDGYEAAKQIRSSRNPLGKKIPIIAMTANAFSEDIRKCLDAGMNGHISKPIDLNVLARILGENRGMKS